ncbi:Unknown protein [Striga hermonthica]|uniref:Uncharacterized protein n=1 Tax=Striga hermonthica TaxID=68872 RepID=A0A9N7NHI6_STRHE|nr:Unknown protein [Striga hermonthica]
MPSKSSLLILITFFFAHATSSRHLKEENHGVNVNFGSNSKGTSDCSRIIASMRPVITSKSKEDRLCSVCKKNNGSLEVAHNKPGNQNGVTTNGKALHNATETEVLRRLKVGHKVLHSSILSEEDLMETDYQPPHRKSPIHN